MYNGIDKSLLIGVSKESVDKFNRPMTHNARKLLVRMITWAGTKFAKDFDNNKSKLLEAFAAVYDPCKYEFVNQRYDISTYPGNGRSESMHDAIEAAPGDKKAKALHLLTLANFDNSKWVEGAEFKTKAGYVGNILHQTTSDVYQWVVTKFVVTDFNDHDLNKICEIGATRISMDVLKTSASNIYDDSKRTIPYLFAIVRDVAIKDTVARDAGLVEDRRSREAMARAMQYAGVPANKYSISDEDALSRAADYMSVLDSIKDK